MNNLEVLKKLQLKMFARCLFSIVRNECKTLEEFEAMLAREFGEGCSKEQKKIGWEALQQIECLPDKYRD